MWDEGRGHKDRWSTRVLFRYALLQLPGWILTPIVLLLINRWIDLPAWTILAATVLWMAKDMAMFPIVWRAYDQDPSNVAYPMVGECAVAQERLSPSGYVRVHGELWLAELAPGTAPIEKGRKVRIREVRGLTLIV